MSVTVDACDEILNHILQIETSFGENFFITHYDNMELKGFSSLWIRRWVLSLLFLVKLTTFCTPTGFLSIVDTGMTVTAVQYACEGAHQDFSLERNFQHKLYIEMVSLQYGSEYACYDGRLWWTPCHILNNWTVSLHYACGSARQEWPFGRNFYHRLYIQMVSLRYGYGNACYGRFLKWSSDHILHSWTVFGQCAREYAHQGILAGRNFYHKLCIQKVSLRYGCEDVCYGCCLCWNFYRIFRI